MARHPTLIADQLEALAASLASRAREGHLLSAPELERLAGRIQSVARQTAPIEWFHAEMVAEAAEEELRQFSTGADFVASATGLPIST